MEHYPSEVAGLCSNYSYIYPFVMLVSGYVTDWMLKGEKKGEDK